MAAAMDTDCPEMRAEFIVQFEPSNELIVGDIDPGLESEIFERNNVNAEEKPLIFSNKNAEEKPLFLKTENAEEKPLFLKTENAEVKPLFLKTENAEEKPDVKFERDEKPIVPFDEEEKKPKVKLEDNAGEGTSVLWNIVKDMDIIKKEERWDDADIGCDIVSPEDILEDGNVPPLVHLTKAGSAEPKSKVDVEMKIENGDEDKAFTKVKPHVLKSENDALVLNEIFDYNSTNVCLDNIGSNSLVESRDTFNTVTLNDKMENKFNKSTQTKAKPFETTGSGTPSGGIDGNTEQAGEVGKFNDAVQKPMTDFSQTNSFPDNNQQSAQDKTPLSKTTKARAFEKARTNVTEEPSPTITNSKTPKEVKTSNKKSPDEVRTSIKKAPLEPSKATEEVKNCNPPAVTSRVKCGRQHVIKLECLYCGNMYDHRAVMLRHMVKFHGDMSKQHICDECGKKLKTRANFINHKRRCHAVNGEFICNTCSAKFKQRWNLTDHMKNKHLQKKCKKCAKEFVGDKPLREHIRLVHGIGNQNICLCPVCGKGLTDNHRLERHMLIHSDEKPHACEQCGKCFRTEGNLHQHSRSHSEERPFKCDVCDKGFRIKHHLKQHMATHGMTSVPKYGRRSKKTC